MSFIKKDEVVTRLMEATQAIKMIIRVNAESEALKPLLNETKKVMEELEEVITSEDVEPK